MDYIVYMYMKYGLGSCDRSPGRVAVGCPFPGTLVRLA